MSINLLTEHYLEFLSIKGGCTGSSESTHVKTPHCWKSHVTAQIWYKTCHGLQWLYFVTHLYASFVGGCFLNDVLYKSMLFINDL